jgi:hypothetical protein
MIFWPYFKTFGIPEIIWWIELEGLVVAVEHQRKGVGSALVKEFIKELDIDYSPCYLLASPQGKGLYEVLGWEVLGENRRDLTKFGWRKENVSWFMKREGRIRL